MQWSAILKFSSAGVSQFGASGADVSSGISEVGWVTFDEVGAAWVVGSNSQQGAELNGSTGAVLASATAPGNVAYAFTAQVDAEGSVWVANGGTNILSQLHGSGSTISGVSYLDPNGDTNSGLFAAQVDGSGNVWAVDSDGYVVQWLGLAAPQSTPVMPTTYGARP